MAHCLGRSDWSICATGRLESLVNFQNNGHVANVHGHCQFVSVGRSHGSRGSHGHGLGCLELQKEDFLCRQWRPSPDSCCSKNPSKRFGIQLVVGDANTALSDEKLRSDLCGVLLSYPDLDGQIKDFQGLTESVHAEKALVVVATDLLALTALKPPGEWGADIAFGNTARFGVPAGYGGPHAAFFACTEKLKREDAWKDHRSESRCAWLTSL
jgi:glycine dehydrogenase